MDKYIGFDIDSKKTVACIVQTGKRDRYMTIGCDIKSMAALLKAEKKDGCRVFLAFEISGQAGFIYDSLVEIADEIKVVNPSKATWIYRTAKKNDKIDARKMAVLYKMGELPEVYMPTRPVRQWRETILHRKKIVCKVISIKNRIRAILKSQGHCKACDTASWWSKAARAWMQSICTESAGICELWRLHLSDLLAELELLEDQLKKVTDRLDKYLSHHPGARC